MQIELLHVTIFLDLDFASCKRGICLVIPTRLKTSAMIIFGGINQTAATDNNLFLYVENIELL